ncbi:hypothetical protein KUCAC02_001083, partial [Chaenocephalus aceratus]
LLLRSVSSALGSVQRAEATCWQPPHTLTAHHPPSASHQTSASDHSLASASSQGLLRSPASAHGASGLSAFAWHRLRRMRLRAARDFFGGLLRLRTGCAACLRLLGIVKKQFTFFDDAKQTQTSRSPRAQTPLAPCADAGDLRRSPWLLADARALSCVCEQPGTSSEIFSGLLRLRTGRAACLRLLGIVKKHTARPVRRRRRPQKKSLAARRRKSTLLPSVSDHSLASASSQGLLRSPASAHGASGLSAFAWH